MIFSRLFTLNISRYILDFDYFILSDKTIGFSAYRTSSLTNYHQKTVIYNTAQTNKGSGYNTATGIFTAPVAGTYVFIWHAMTKHKSIGYFCQLYLCRNGVRLNFAAHADGNETTGGTDSGSNSVVLSLSIGDTVFIKTASCYYLYSEPFTSFSGFKIWKYFWDYFT